MALDVWFQDDIQNAIIGIDYVSGTWWATCGNGVDAPTYRNGLDAAMNAVAIGFSPIATALQPELPNDGRDSE